MSSAILYLAIVAIWACVLIPRWLRRDSARGATAAPPAPAEPSATVEADPDSDSDSELDEDESEPLADPGPEPVTADESRRRMLLARRRLLLMLIGLEITAIALAFLGLAALWVIVPPTVMLGGYVLLLREASRADAEQAQFESEAEARARERTRARTLAARATSKDTPAEGTSTAGIPAAAAALAARFAAAPVPADYEDSGPGRDFAPGLAGKYTPATADTDADLADDDYYDDGYQPPRLRAVGD